MSKKSPLRNWENLSESLLGISKNGRFPTMKEIRKNLGRVVADCVNSFGGSYEVAKRLNLKIDRKPKWYWRNTDNLFFHLKTLGTCNGRVVTKFLGSGAQKAIYHFGGFAEISRHLGINLASKTMPTSDGHVVRSHYEFILDEYLSSRNIKHEVDEVILPCKSKYRFDFKINDFYVEIWGYSKSDLSTKQKRYYNHKRTIKELFYKNNNLKLISIEADVFKQPIDKIVMCLDSIFSKIELDVIEKHPINLTTPKSESLQEKTVQEFKLLIENLGYFPSSSKLYNLKLFHIIGCIKKLGGYRNFISKFFDKEGFKKPNGFWTEETIKKELSETVTKFNIQRPTQKSIISVGRRDLVSAMSSRGGLVKFLNQIGMKPVRKAYYKYGQNEYQI